MDETREIMLAINHSVDMLAAKFDGFQAEVRQEFSVLKADVAELKVDVAELKTDVAALQQGQLRQERIMEKLSLRSMEYETIVSDLQRLHK